MDIDVLSTQGSFKERSERQCTIEKLHASLKIGFYKSFSFVLAAEVSKCGWCPKLVNDRCLRILLKVKLFLTTLNHFSLLSISVIAEYEKAVQQSMVARESFLMLCVLLRGLQKGLWVAAVFVCQRS